MIMLLSACGHAPGGVGPAEELALTIRGEYAALSTWTAQAEITADYGQRVYEYAVAAEFDGAQTRLTLTAPGHGGRTHRRFDGGLRGIGI